MQNSAASLVLTFLQWRLGWFQSRHFSIDASMPEKLPKGWVKTTLGEVCTRIATIQPEDSPDTEFTYFDIGGIDNQSNRIVATKSFLGRDAPSRARQSVRKGDILFSTVRTYLKKIAFIEQDYPNPVASTGFVVIRAAEGVLPRFLFWQVLAEEFLQPVHALQSGSSYPAVREKDVFAQPIWLAPTREQEGIVEKLGALLSQVVVGETATRRALERIQRYRAAVLYAAVTGELTSDWRKQNRTLLSQRENAAQLLMRITGARRKRWEDAELKRFHSTRKLSKDDKWKKRYRVPGPVSQISSLEHPSTWEWTSLEHITLADRPICYGILMPKQHIPHGIPYVKVRDMKGDQINVAGLQRTSYEIAAAYARSTLREGDLVLAIRGTYGRIAVVPPELDGGNITQDTARLAVCPPINVAYVMWAIRCDFIQTHFKKVARGIAVKGVNIADVRSTPLPLPPLIEQEEIVHEVDRRFRAAERLATTLNRQLKEALSTRQSLLHEAFAGKLISQDLNDEPASILLNRIHITREADAKKPKATHMPKTKLRSVETLEQLEALIYSLGKGATPESILLAAGLGDDVATFFDLLRAGRDKGSLLVPVGKGTAIKRIQHAN